MSLRHTLFIFSFFLSEFLDTREEADFRTVASRVKIITKQSKEHLDYRGSNNHSCFCVTRSAIEVANSFSDRIFSIGDNAIGSTEIFTPAALNYPLTGPVDSTNRVSYPP